MGRTEPYKVVLWAPGYTGTQALREIARRPELELVGCLAYSESKAGRDAMDLIGEPTIGVPVVTDKTAIYELDADVVLYAGRALPDETLCTTVKSVSLREICDLSHHSGDAIRGIGFGMEPGRLGSKTRKILLSRYYFECIAGLAHLLGILLDKMTAQVSYPVSEHEVQCAAVTIRPGTVGAVDGTWAGFVGEEQVITIREVWYLDRNLVDPGIDLVSDDM